MIDNSRKLDMYRQWLKQYREIWGTYTRPKNEKLASSICRPTDLDSLTEWNELKSFTFSYGDKAQVLTEIDETRKTYYEHRKIWEWVYICRALKERGMLKDGMRGLCFAVGKEPLPAIFANLGCIITATDAPPKNISAKWDETNQHSDDLSYLYYPHIVGKQKFFENTSFRYADMKYIPSDLKDYDFIWSSCSLEHLGSMHAAKDFIYRAMDCLRPGGVAVHTTEFNLKSGVETSMMGSNSILRSVDFIEIAEHLEWQGHKIEPLDFRLDGSSLDDAVSFPPEYIAPHFKIPLRHYIATSFGLIINKGL